MKNGIFFCSLEENSSRTNWSKYISIWFINKYKLLQRLHFLETIYDSLPNSISYLLSESLSGTEPSPSVLRLISKYCHKKGVFEEKRVLLRTIPFSYQDYKPLKISATTLYGLVKRFVVFLSGYGCMWGQVFSY